MTPLGKTSYDYTLKVHLCVLVFAKAHISSCQGFYWSHLRQVNGYFQSIGKYIVPNQYTYLILALQ